MTNELNQAITLSQQIIDLCNLNDQETNDISLQVENNALKIRDILEATVKKV